MWSWLKRLFPENLFSRKIDPSAERRLRLAQARAEESIIRTHVDNALMFVDTLATDAGYERALDIYVRELGVPEPLASVVATRALVALGDALVPPPPVVPEREQVLLPKLRLAEADLARKRRA